MLCAAAFSAPVLANDGFGALGAGGIVVGHTDKIAMAREELEISYHTISVDYDFVNESDADVTETVSFPLPPYPATPKEGGVTYNGQPPDFRLMVEHKPVRFTTHVWARIDGKDVTAKLRHYGFTDKQIALVPFEDSVNQHHHLSRPAALLRDMRADGLLGPDDEPLWTNYVAYEWRQTFSAHKTLNVNHVYHPFIAVGTAGGYADESDLIGPEMLKRDFCATPATLAAMRQRYAVEENRDAYGDVPGTIVEYVLTTGNTWKDGIRDFTLRISKGSPHEILSLCSDAEFTRVDAQTVEAKIKNFHPKSDLKIYFGDAWYTDMPDAPKPSFSGVAAHD